MLKKILATVVGLLIIVGAIVGIKADQIKTLLDTKAVQPPEGVSTTQVKKDGWRDTLAAVGSLSAVQGVTVAAELDGKIVEVDFEAGKQVTKGDILVRQDTSAEEAQLRAAQAAAELARINLKRTGELLARATVSQSSYDSDAAAFKQAVAGADNIQATIDKKTIRAPFSGRLGIRLINLGQNLKAGDSIVSLQALDPIFVDFYLPQQDVLRIQQGLKVVLSGDALGGSKPEGTITAISPDIDTSTRNIRVQATLANTGGHLVPGMYVDVSVELPNVSPVLSIPATAILYAPYGDTVFVVESKKDESGADQLVVRQQIVRLGINRGDFVAVKSGLKEGETVVTSGVFRLRPGSTVTVNNALAPDASLAPKPDDS